MYVRNDAPPLTFLGAGYVGKALLRLFPAADVTHRQPAIRAHVFDLSEPGTWGNPPLAGRAVIWSFAAEPVAAVQAFYDAYLKDAKSLIVLGSTSAYLVQETAESPVVTVTEQTPLDLAQPRVQGEEWLRNQGATVLQLAGIFGPGRDPAGWLHRERIQDGARLVNLIHVDDIVAVVAHLLVHPLPGERINVANGESLPWRELAARFRRDGRVPPNLVLHESSPHEHGKHVNNRRLRSLLPGHDFLRP